MSTRKTASSSTAKKTARKNARASSATDPGARKPASKNLLTAGIKALTQAHDEVVARQKGVFESLLGIHKAQDASSANPLASAALDPFGFRKFEDVFDQRVARTLQRLGVSSAEEMTAQLASLRSEVETLRAEMADLRAAVRGSKR